MKKMQDGNINENLGSVIKYLREKKGLSLVELNELTGISPSYISRIENGTRLAPTVPIILSLANALEIDVFELFSIAGIENNEKVKVVGELILSNDVIFYNSLATKEQKELLVKVIDIIFYSDWDLKYYDCIAEVLKAIYLLRRTFNG